MARYVDSRELFAEIIKSKEQNKLTPRALELLMRMAREIMSKVLKYKVDADREDCISFAIEDVLRYWDRFDPEKSTNAFAFYTTMIKNGSAKGWRRLHPIKSSHKISINQEGGVYNF